MSLAELVLRDFVRVPEPKPTADGSFLRISSITSCDRKQIFDGFQLPVRYEGDEAINGFVAREIGNTLHDCIQDAFATDKQAIRDFECEIPVSIPYALTSGHTDGVYKAPSGERRILEIKTMRNYGFRKARKDNMPKEEHLFQATAYALALDVHYIHMVYVCTDATPGRWKDSAKAGDMYEWVFNIHDDISDTGASLIQMTTYFLEQHKNMAQNVLDTGVLPAGLLGAWNGTFQSKDELPWECRYCPHLEVCPTVSYIEDVLQIKESYDSTN